MECTTVRSMATKVLAHASEGYLTLIHIRTTLRHTRTCCHNALYCSFCQKPYHVEADCFKKNPKLRDQGKDVKGRKAKSDNSQIDARKSSKRRSGADDEDDNAGGPRDPKRPTFMATAVSEGDVNAAFGKDVEGNLAQCNRTLTMMATKTLSIHDAWIVDSGCA